MVNKLTSDNVESFVHNYPTKHTQGFTGSEIINILKKYDIDNTKFYTGLGVNTCMVINGESITYHCDILKGLRCVLENREQTFEEFD
jgi:hypothetical protein